MWQSLANSLPKKFCQKEHHVFHHIWSPIMLLKNCIALILTQKCNKLLNNIMLYICSNNVSKKKKLGPTHVCDSWCTTPMFWRMQRRCLKNVRVLWIQNKIILCVYVAIKMKLGYITEEESIKHQNIMRVATKPSAKLIFRESAGFNSCWISKCCMVRLWNEVYRMWTCAKPYLLHHFLFLCQLGSGRESKKANFKIFFVNIDEFFQTFRP